MAATMEVTERAARAMGSDVHLIVVGGPANLSNRLLARIDDLEHRWSRFIPSSEVSRMNRAAGAWVDVSPETVLLVERAIEAWRVTGGGFDPTVLGAMLAAGYDRSFELLDPLADTDPVGDDVDLAGLPIDEHDDPDLPTAAAPPTPRWALVGCTDIEIERGAVRLPSGVGFDPGGIGKGLCADLVVEQALGSGADGICVNMGGDVRVAGCAPDGGTWTISIDHPQVSMPLTLVGLASGAVATSTTLRRAWQHDGSARHHLIDPATGEPSTSDLELVSVVAAEAWMAEVFAKAMLLRGAERAFDIVVDGQTAALTVDVRGEIRSTPSLTAFTGGMRRSKLTEVDPR